MTAIRVIRFPVDGPPVEAHIENTLESFQTEVGGYIEIIGNYSGCGAPFNLVLNEDGKILDLPVNLAATQVVKSVLNPGDYIVGDAVLTGPHDENGELTSLPDWIGLPS